MESVTKARETKPVRSVGTEYLSHVKESRKVDKTIKARGSTPFLKPNIRELAIYTEKKLIQTLLYRGVHIRFSGDRVTCLALVTLEVPSLDKLGS